MIDYLDDLYHEHVGEESIDCLAGDMVLDSLSSIAGPWCRRAIATWCEDNPDTLERIRIRAEYDTLFGCAAVLLVYALISRGRGRQVDELWPCAHDQLLTIYADLGHDD